MLYQKGKQDLQKKGSKVMTSKRFSVISFLCNNPLSAQINLNSVQDVRAALMKIINAIIEENSWAQAKAGKILGIDQPKICNIKHLRVAGFSLRRLSIFLHRLNYEVNLIIKMQDDAAIIKVEPDIKDTKLEIMKLINNIIAKRKLSQKKAADLMGTTQAKICHINMLKTYHISLEFLLNLLGKMNYHIELIVKEQTP